MPRPELLNPGSAGLSPSFPYPAAFGLARAVPSTGSTRRPAFAHHVLLPSPYADDALAADGRRVTAAGDPTTAFRTMATMMGLDRPSDDDDDGETTDEDTDDGTGPDGGSRPAAKRARRPNGGGAAAGGDVLPDLPRAAEPSADRRTTDFTVQEHTFLAWAKTMSTFKAKRQAKIKMKINKIMSEAEFEDLDDEFFAGNWFWFASTDGRGQLRRTTVNE